MRNAPTLATGLFHWLLYLILSVIGLGFVPTVDGDILRIGTDGGMMTCFGIGMLITTCVFAFCRWRKYRFSYRPMMICVVGFLSFVPGYVVAYFVGLSGAF